jgi:hypothetical protein
MSRPLDHARHNARVLQRELTTEASSVAAHQDWQRIGELDRQRVAKITRSHPRHPLCRAVAKRLDGGDAPTKAQAAAVLRVAAEQGWSTAIERTSLPVDPTRQPGKIEADLCGYLGRDVLLVGFVERCQQGEALTDRERGQAGHALRLAQERERREDAVIGVLVRISELGGLTVELSAILDAIDDGTVTEQQLALAEGLREST